MRMCRLSFIIAFLLFLPACCKPRSDSYRDFYKYCADLPQEESIVEAPFYVLFLVNARHLDYGSLPSFMKTCAKHPSDGSKNGDVGHAWVYLKSPNEVIEGGQSGETGLYQPRYLEGVLENADLGADNPVCYLWEPQCDGFFQRGAGGHRPTFAAKIDLTEQQYHIAKDYITSYDFSDYRLSEHQCTTFVKGLAESLGIELDDQVILYFPQELKILGRTYCLWKDEKFHKLTCGSPDKLEESLVELVRRREAVNATCWYIRNHYEGPNEAFKTRLELLPSRTIRWCKL